MNCGRIFTEPRNGEVNILLLFTEIERNNYFRILTQWSQQHFLWSFYFKLQLCGLFTLSFRMSL